MRSVISSNRPKLESRLQGITLDILEVYYQVKEIQISQLEISNR